MSDLLELALDTDQAYERGKVDVNFFASLCMPDIFVYSLPVFYITVWQILVNRKKEDIGKILRFALGLPRGHAKTTFIKILLAWLIVYDKARFILIVCANEDLAENLLSDLHDILSSPNVEAIYGDWSGSLSKDTKEQKRAFYHGRNVILAAKGAGSSLRGLNIKNDRPDVIFCDDVQTRENDESPTERASLLRWLVSTLFKVITPKGDRLILYLGNMYSDACILYLLKKNPGWISFITGAILDNKQPLWPELHSIEDLMESFYHDENLGLADLWFAEVMNDPKSAATTILPLPLPKSPVLTEDIQKTQWASTFITIDPAGFRKHSDANQIIVHGVLDGKGHIIYGRDDLQKPDDIIKETLNLAIMYGCCLIGVESVGYQQTLAFWFNFWITKLHITGIEIVELDPHGQKKESRIRQFIQECYAENYYVTDAECKASFIWEANKYKLSKRDNTDNFMDACAYGLDVRNDYWQLLREPVSARALPDHIAVVEDNTAF